MSKRAFRMRTRISALLLTVLLITTILPLSIFNVFASTETKAGVYTITVRGDDGPVKDATVVVELSKGPLISVKTDEKGEVAIPAVTNESNAVDNFALTVQAVGFESYSHRVKVVDKTENYTVTLKRSRVSVTAYVRTNSGNISVANATVNISGTEDFTAKTNSEGKCEFSLQYGKPYTATVKYQGFYEWSSSEKTFKEDATWDVILVTKPKDDTISFQQSAPTPITYGSAFSNVATSQNDAQTQLITYSVTKGSDVVAVDASGVVITKKAGTATIRASIPEGDVYRYSYKEYELEVLPKDSEAIQFVAGYSEISISYSPGKIFMNSATGGSGTGAITYKIKSGDAASVDATTGDVSVIKAGTVVISAQKQSDGIYAASDEIKYTLIIVPEEQEPLLFNTKTPGDIDISIGTYTNTATGGTGKGAISYEIINGDAASIDATTGKLTFVKTGAVTVKATKAADDCYKQKTVSYTITIKSSQQELGFDTSAPGEITYEKGLTFTNMASGGAETGNDIVYSITSSKNYLGNAVPRDYVAVINSITGELTIKAAGTVTVKATKKGNSEYLTTEKEYTLTIKRGVQSEFVYVDSNPTITYDFVNNKYSQAAPVTYTANTIIYATSNTSCASFDKTTGIVTIASAGSILIKASVGGDARYEPAETSYTLTINRLAQEDLKFKDVFTEYTYNGIDENEIILNTQGGSGDGAVTYSIVKGDAVALYGSTLKILKSGSVTIKAVKAQDKFYSETEATIDINIKKDTQAIKFAGTKDTCIYGNTFATTALPERDTTAPDGYGYARDTIISYEVTTGNQFATVDSKGQLTFANQGVGDVVVKATKHGNDCYEEASIEYSFTVVYYSKLPTIPYTLEGTRGTNGWFTSDVTIKPAINYTISESNNLTGNTWLESIMVTNEGATEKTVYFKYGNGISDAVAVKNNGEDIKIDKASPYNLSIAYEESVVQTFLEIASFGFYDAKTTVTITAFDTTSGISYFEYSLDGVKYTKIEPENITYDEEKAEAKFEIEPQYRGIISFRAVDCSGRTTSFIDNKTIVVDNIAPGIDVSYDVPDGDAKINEGIKYFNTDRKATITITEANNFESDLGNSLKIILSERANDAVDYTEIVPELSKNGDDYTATILFNNDADYKLDISYTDHSNNVGEWSDSFTIDKISPVISQSVFAEGIVKNDIGGKQYYDANQKATFTITEHNFKAEDVVVTVTAKDAKANDVTVTDYQAFAADNSNWTHEGDIHTLVLDFDVDANYTLDVAYNDLAGNADTGYEQNVFAIDNLNPYDLSIDYEESFAQAFIEMVSFGFYNAKTTVTITAYDTTAGISYFEYSLDGVEYKKIEAANITYIGEKAVAKFEIEPQYRGIITFNAIDSSNRITSLTGDKTIVVDDIAPVITVSYDVPDDDAKVIENNKYFNTNRKATIKITEHNFWSDNVVVTVTAKDAEGNTVKTADYQAFAKNNNNWTHEGDIHTLVLDFDVDANYTFDVEYDDLSGNIGNAYIKDAFTIDTKAPVATAKADKFTNTWETLIEAITFGLWSNDDVKVTAECSDETSPIASFEYYKTDGVTAFDVFNFSDWKLYEPITVEPNEQFVVYYKIVDNAGNATYISTNGIIVDNVAPEFEKSPEAPEIHFDMPEKINGFYTGDVEVGIRVIDPIGDDGSYSGIKTIRYEVYNLGILTKSEELYSFEETGPSKQELLQMWSGRITISSEDNNSNDVELRAYAVDNAGNVYSEVIGESKTDYASEKIKIDIVDPLITVSYDNNAQDEDFEGFFKANRTATITVTERNFNKEKVVVTLIKDNVTATEIRLSELLKWSEIKGDGNGDLTTHTSTLDFNEDGDYEFYISCKDEAERECTIEEVVYGNSASPKEFTIDKTLPVVRVSYDNNDVLNGNYYKEARTATIRVTEHNWEESRIVTILKATDDGDAVSLPRLSRWSTNGDVHTATIEYDSDALYEFDFDYTDKAGNAAANIQKQTFYVDKTAPSLVISGVEDSSANNGDVIPVVTYSDTNFDITQVTITLNGANRDKVELLGNYSEQDNGQIFTFDNFAEEAEIDDIYTLYASLTDKAGNNSTQTIKFSVNRFGSTYEFDEYVSNINNTYVKQAEDITITETNVDALKSDETKVNVFKNNDSILLTKDTDYKVEQLTGGDGKWYSYKYTVFSSVFADDAVYKVVIHSEDAAGNIAENSLDTKKKDILFGVDSTVPNIVVSNLSDGTTYALENLTVKLSSDDNLLLEKVEVELDGIKVQAWDAKAIKELMDSGSDFSIDVPGTSTGAHVLRIICTDAAGNIQEKIISNFYVTTNLWVRYYNNKMLFFGTIGGIVLLAGLIIVVVVLRKKKVSD